MALSLTPATDPAYLAFLRAQGIEESDAMGEIDRRVSSLTRGLTRRMPVYADRAERSQEGVTSDFEDRGLYRSGARLVAQQRAANDVERDRLEDIAGTQDGVADAYAGGARTVAALRRQQTEQELSTRAGL